MSVYEEGAHARNRFENRRLSKRMEHIAFTQRYAQTRLDDEIRTVRDNLRDIRKNTGHSSSMDSDGVRSFCRGHYVSSQQRRAAEQIDRGECFDWTLTLDRDMDSVKVPDSERGGNQRASSRGRQTGVRRSASLKNTVCDTGAHGMPPVVAADLGDDLEQGSFTRSASFHGTPRRTSMRKGRLENTPQKTGSKQTSGTTVKRAESFQGVTEDGRLPQSGLRRSSSTQSLRGSLQSGSKHKSGSVEHMDLLPLDARRSVSSQQQRPTPRDGDSLKLPKIAGVSSGAAEVPQSSRRERARQKRKQRGGKTSDPYDIDLNTLVADIVVDDEAVSDMGSLGSRQRDQSLDRWASRRELSTDRGSLGTSGRRDVSTDRAAAGRRDRSSSRSRSTKLKPVGKTQKPPRPAVLAWEPESALSELHLPAVPNTTERHSSTSCPLPDRQTADAPRSSRKLSCPEDNLPLVADSPAGEDEEVFGAPQEEVETEEAETEEDREARRRKVLNARAANSGMSFAEFRSKRQGDIKVAMSPRQLRKIRAQIIQQRSRKDTNPSAGEQARYRHIEDKVRSFLHHDMFNQSELSSGTDSYNSEEEGALV